MTVVGTVLIEENLDWCEWQHGRQRITAAYAVAHRRKDGGNRQLMGVCRMHLVQYLNLLMEPGQEMLIAVRRLR